MGNAHAQRKRTSDNCLIEAVGVSCATVDAVLFSGQENSTTTQWVVHMLAKGRKLHPSLITCSMAVSACISGSAWQRSIQILEHFQQVCVPEHSELTCIVRFVATVLVTHRFELFGLYLRDAMQKH
eukprot:1875928-Amphidinium_carterae.1